MALMKCPECQKDMSDTLDACPHCGFKRIKSDSSNNTTCISCGKSYDKDASYCSNCGEKKEQSAFLDKTDVDYSNFKSMIKCECGNIYSIYTKECPKCNSINLKYKKIPILKFAIIVIAFLSIIGYLISSKQDSYNNVNVTYVSPNTNNNVIKQKINYKIGERGPAGGWIIYDKGNTKGGWRYLEAAPEDIRGNDKYVQWASNYRIIGAFGTAIGTGKSNTKKIVQALGYGEYAAKLCVDYRGGGKDDWFLPSMEELNLLYKRLYKKGIGNMERSFYWSSSEHVKGFHAKNLTFNDGEYFTNAKIIGNSVRPIRQF